LILSFSSRRLRWLSIWPGAGQNHRGASRSALSFFWHDADESKRVSADIAVLMGRSGGDKGKRTLVHGVVDAVEMQDASPLGYVINVRPGVIVTWRVTTGLEFEETQRPALPAFVRAYKQSLDNLLNILAAERLPEYLGNVTDHARAPVTLVLPS
jgi:hypothetical protein